MIDLVQFEADMITGSVQAFKVGAGKVLCDKPRNFDLDDGTLMAPAGATPARAAGVS